VPFRIIGKAPASCRVGLQSRDPSVHGLSPTPVFPPGTFLAIPLHSPSNCLAYSADRHMRGDDGRGQRRHRSLHRGISTTGSTAGSAARRTATAVTPMTVVTARCQSKEGERQRNQQIANAHGEIPLFLGCTATRGSHATVLEDTWFAGQGTEGWDGGVTHKNTGQRGGTQRSAVETASAIDHQEYAPRTPRSNNSNRPRPCFLLSPEKGCERGNMNQLEE